MTSISPSHPPAPRVTPTWSEAPPPSHPLREGHGRRARGRDQIKGSGQSTEGPGAAPDPPAHPRGDPRAPAAVTTAGSTVCPSPVIGRRRSGRPCPASRDSPPHPDRYLLPPPTSRHRGSRQARRGRLAPQWGQGGDPGPSPGPGSPPKAPPPIDRKAQRRATPTNIVSRSPSSLVRVIEAASNRAPARLSSHVLDGKRPQTWRSWTTVTSWPSLSRYAKSVR